MLVSWQWLSDYLGETSLTPAEAVALLGTYAFEIEDVKEQAGDTIIDVDVLPNRASDCLNHRGIARELAAITDTPLKHDPLRLTPKLTKTDAIAVTIDEPTACPRLAASLITGVTVGASPAWLVARLKAIGQRSINNLVDATNYVMFALGQPIHAYDADRFPQVDGVWQFVARFAKAGEMVELLPERNDQQSRTITCLGSELLIVDGSTNQPIGLAGVKGGRFAEVSADTKNVLIETAHFNPTMVRKTARRLGIVIDASKRFENEPARKLIPYAQAEVSKLITDIAGGVYKGTVDISLAEKPNPEVTLNPKRIKALMGVDLSLAEMTALLRRVGATVREVKESNQLVAVGPWERTDLNIEEDFIEEIARLYGYRHVIATPPAPRPLPAYNARHYYGERIRHALQKLGYSEVITSSFRQRDQVRLKNALASDKSYLRSNLSLGLTKVLDKNAGFVDLLGTADTRVFEIGTVFAKAKDGTDVTEHVALAIGARVKQTGYSGKEDGLLKKATAAVADALGVAVEWTLEQGVAETNLTKLLANQPAPVSYEPAPVGEAITYQPFSPYQHMSRDIALWVTAGVSAEEVKAVLNQQAGALRVRTTLFDEFEKDGRVSFGFRLVFQAPDRTLTDNEVNGLMETVYAAVAKHGWEVR